MTDRHAFLRRAWRDHFATVDRISRQNVEAEEASRERMFAGDGYQPFVPQPYPAFPDELRGLTCGARTRAGTPCRRTDLERSGRCKFHGGRSSGPTSPDGIARARQNLALRWRTSEAREDLTNVNVERVIAPARARDGDCLTTHDESPVEADGVGADPAISGQIARARDVEFRDDPAASPIALSPEPAPFVANAQPAALSADALAAIKALAARRRGRVR